MWVKVTQQRNLNTICKLLQIDYFLTTAHIFYAHIQYTIC